jgi:toxin ParE1/3/4
MAEYRLTPAAEGDLEAIWTYTLQQWSAEPADRYIDTLTAAPVELAQSPKIASACDQIRPGYRRRSIGAAYDLFSNDDVWNCCRAYPP